ncbi:GNAT family N-acetyltransferase [Aeromicrobium sp. Sec7.5]|uniref:GNAT family N-acetyltransferase n=1 Tax=Aeromicrobium sp. Sec7.5 TaxID=3121276 RepID=UPI002FE4AF1A
MTIELAETNSERAELQALFSHVFEGISDDAVPRVEHDDLYAPLLPLIRDAEGSLLAAAMSCRTELASAAIMASRIGRGDPFGVIGLLDKHSELDLVAVQPSARGRGYGSRLIQWLDSELEHRGVRAWFGNVTVNLETDRLREFYRRHGFEIVPDFQPLPPLLGKSWMKRDAQMPQFYFYKRPGN